MTHFKPIIELYKTSAKNKTPFDTALKNYKDDPQTLMRPDDWSTTFDKVNIKAVACWETVGAMGVPQNSLAKLLKLNEQWTFLDTNLPLRKSIST
jgi:hypothetical protein